MNGLKYDDGKPLMQLRSWKPNWHRSSVSGMR